MSSQDPTQPSATADRVDACNAVRYTDFAYRKASDRSKIGERFAVVVQADELLPRSVTSRSKRSGPLDDALTTVLGLN